MDPDLDTGALRALTDRMIAAITSPAYVDAMRAVKAAPEDRRLDEAMRRLDPDALRAKGVPLPEGMRISSRYFEAGMPSIEVGQRPSGRNLLRDLNDGQPGILDRLRLKDRDLFDRINKFLEDDFGPVALCGCACGGAATVCGGAGGG